MHKYASKNNTNNEHAKIYFPSIPIQVLQHALHGAPNHLQSQKQNKTIIDIQKNTQTKRQLDKYLCSETQKTTIYGTTSILEIHNNEPYAVYPSDKMILTSSIPVSYAKQSRQMQLLIDYSTTKHSQCSSYQIPYDFKVHSYVVKKYRMSPKSDTSFVIEYKDNKIYDFYVLAKLSTLPIGLSTTQIEIDNFIKEDIISFLLMLNLY